MTSCFPGYVVGYRHAFRRGIVTVRAAGGTAGGAARQKARRWEGKSPDALRRRWRRPELWLYSRIDSTNERAKELGEAGSPAGTLVLADEQTAGRGRAGHRWYSPKGDGLYFTLLLRPRELHNPGLVPIVGGLAVARTLRRLLPDASVGLKWPNDVLLDGWKCGGVLAEASWGGARMSYMILGVGLNVHNKIGDFPGELRDVVTSVDVVAGRKVSRLEIMDLLLGELDGVLAKPPDTLDRDDLRDLDGYDWLRGRRCTVKEPGRDRVTRGVAVGIAPDGALLFRPDTGPLKRVLAGHVTLPELPLPEY